MRRLDHAQRVDAETLPATAGALAEQDDDSQARKKSEEFVDRGRSLVDIREPSGEDAGPVADIPGDDLPFTAREIMPTSSRYGVASKSSG